MIAHIRTIRLAPGGLARAIEILRDDQLPVLRQAPGFVGLLVLASLSDSTAGERIEAVALWDNQLTRDTFDADGNERARVTPAIPQLAAPIEEHTYEVAQSAGMFGGTVARFISARLHPGHIDAVVTLFENVVMHAATEQHGFRRGILLVDRVSGRAISIGLWHTEADLHASEQVGYVSQQIGNFTHMLTAPITPEQLMVAAEG